MKVKLTLYAEYIYIHHGRINMMNIEICQYISNAVFEPGMGSLKAVFMILSTNMQCFTTEIMSLCLMRLVYQNTPQFKVVTASPVLSFGFTVFNVSIQLLLTTYVVHFTKLYNDMDIQTNRK